MQSNRIIRWKHLGIVFVILLAGIIMQLYFQKREYDAELNGKLEQLHEFTTKVMKQSKADLLLRYGSIVRHYMSVPQVVSLIESNDHDALYRALLEDYRLMQEANPELTVMHMIDTDNRTIIRMHRPDSYGDDLTALRPIMVFANRNLKAVQGFEVGKNGLTYRVTIPMITPQGKHLGVLEFGVRPKYFAHRINDFITVESQLLIRKDALTIHYSKNQKRPVIGEYAVIDPNPLFETILPHIDWQKPLQQVRAVGHEYLIDTSQTLQDFRGGDAARLILAEEISVFVSDSMQKAMLRTMITLLLSGGLLVLLYVVFGSYSRQIERSYQRISSLNQHTQKLHRENRKLSKKAHIDPLTSCHNRTRFDEYIAEVLDAGMKGSLLFFDIDHFKHINDTYGHKTGDMLLEKLSEHVRLRLRENDFFARWGGEEFAIVLPGSSVAHAQHKAEELRYMIENSRMIENETVTCSFGVTQIQPDDTPRSLIERADRLLYQAKNGGRNQIRSYEISASSLSMLK